MGKHRIGYLYEDFISLENCIEAEKRVGLNKKHNRKAKHISKHAEEYAVVLHETLVTNSWIPSENRVVYIIDSYKGKERMLKIPCLFDQAVENAWLNVAEPHIQKRLYRYCCGSVPKRGQTDTCKALQGWVNKGYKYGTHLDIRKFYDTIPHWLVMKNLRNIFKDEKFLKVAEQILASMSDTGIGIAIGHPISHWFANVALMEMVNGALTRFPNIHFVQYMDDIGAVGSNKKDMHKFVEYFDEATKASGMRLKRNHQVFRIKDRGLSFLSYRFFKGYVILNKPLMYRIARNAKKAGANLTYKKAQGMVSYFGILKHCNSYNFKMERVYPYVNKKKCRRLISKCDKLQNLIKDLKPSKYSEQELKRIFDCEKILRKQIMDSEQLSMKLRQFILTDLKKGLNRKNGQRKLNTRFTKPQPKSSVQNEKS